MVSIGGGDEMNVRQKVMVIDGCLYCDHSFSAGKRTLCGLSERRLEDLFTIPEWCELDDARDYLQWKKEREVEG
jgi:hypothetical protein